MSDTDAALRECIMPHIRNYLGLAERLLARRLTLPMVDFKLRGTTAGRAYPSQWRLSFNAVLMRENMKHFLRQTVGHEVAHLVVHARWGTQVKPHGSEWRDVMRAFELEARASHRYDVSRIARPRSPYVYGCACEETFRLGHVRHQRMTRGVSYRCRRCGRALTFLYRQD
jgi:SprT protein